MAKLNIDINVDDKSVGQSVEKVQSLKTQIRELQKQIQTAKVGSVEFEELSERLKDTRDQFDLVNAKSGDLFDSFNRLPGPIGMIGSTVQGTLDDLKILSSFSFKDLGKQFGAIGDDISLIGGNLAKTTGITKLFNATTLLTSNALKAVGISANVSSKGIRLFSAALVATGIGAIVVALGLLITNFDKVRDSLYKLIPGLKSVTDFVGGLVNKFTDLIGITNEAERAEKKRQETYDKAKKGTDVLNDAIQREINLLKARGATQDEIDKKRKQIIQNELNDLKKLADEKGKLYGEDAKKYKDLQNELAVIDAEAATRRAEASKKAADEAKSRADKKAQEDKARREKIAQEERAFLEAQADAVVQIEKDKEDTNADTLRKALQKQNELKNEGKKVSVEVAKAQADEIEKIVQDEVNKDIEARQKAFDDRVNQLKTINKLIIDEVTSNAELQKATYGEYSKEARAAVDEVFNAQLKALEDEKLLLNTKKELTNEDKLRLREIAVEETNLTNQKILENKKRLQSDLDTFLASEEQAKNNQIARIEREMETAQLDTERLQILLDEKVKLEEDYYNRLLANESLTTQQRAELQKQQTESVRANAQSQIEIEKKRFDAQQQLLAATSGALAAFADQIGKDTVAGKALAVAASLINTYAAIAGQLRAFAGLPIPGYAILQAVATGLVGFKAVRDIIATPVPNTSGSAPLQPRKLASGGVVRGPGGEKSDLIPAMLSNGESVINAKSTSLFRPLLSSINELGGGKKFAEGGLAVSSFSQDDALSKLSQQLIPSTQPIKTYVVASDMTNQQMFDRMAKNRSTL